MGAERIGAGPCAADAAATAVQRLVATIARLREPGGCPWDREQTLESLRPFLLEECYELLEALDARDPARHLDELGDVLLQVVLQARLREEEGAFAFADVARTLTEKMVRRHPHVFGTLAVTDANDVIRNWEAIKAAERGGAVAASMLDGLPRGLPALLRAQRLQARAAKVGFDWPDIAGVWAKLEEEQGELRDAAASGDPDRVADELGDLLFTAVNLCRLLNHQAEAVLHRANVRFERRFRAMEQRLAAAGVSPATMTAETWDDQWNAVKRAERDATPPPD